MLWQNCFQKQASEDFDDIIAVVLLQSGLISMMKGMFDIMLSLLLDVVCLKAGAGVGVGVGGSYGMCGVLVAIACIHALRLMSEKKRKPCVK